MVRNPAQMLQFLLPSMRAASSHKKGHLFLTFTKIIMGSYGLGPV